MAISFNDVPSNLRVPILAAEFDASQAAKGPALLAYRALIIGQRTSAGSWAADSLHRVTSVAEVITGAGRGSMLHRMAIAWFAANRSTELWIGVLDDDGAGVPTQKTITVTGPATADGTIALYIGGRRVTVAVASGDAQNDIAAAIEAALDDDLDLPITAAVSTNVVTTTARNDGLHGNDLDIRDSYREGEALPAGVSLAYAQTVAGTTSPSLTNLIAAMGDTWYHVIAHPYTDATNLTAIENELADRAGSLRMIDGVGITSAAGSHATLTSLGDGRNSKYSVIMAQPGANPLTPPMEHAAEVAGTVAKYAAQDPARPLQTLALTHSLPPADVDLFTIAERNLQLFDGIGTTRVGAGGICQLERVITTYQTNAAGAADTAYLDVTTPLTLQYLRYDWRVRMQTRYPRHKLANDGTRFGPGQSIMTPKLGKAEALVWFREKEEQGLVEGFDQFKQDLVVERNASNPNRLDFLLPPDLINQLMTVGTQIAFRL